MVLATFWARLTIVALLGIVGFTPLVAVAQEAPTYAQGVPSYARPDTEQTIHGRIQSIDGTFNITVADDNGYLDSIQLHQGTIINPRGLTLEPGMSVTILGFNAGSVFQANEIDTPYHFTGPLPVPVYLGPGWWYPGYAYGWGPSFSLRVNFGGGGGGAVIINRAPFVGHAFKATIPAPHPYSGHPYVGRPIQGHVVAPRTGEGERREPEGEHRDH